MKDRVNKDIAILILFFNKADETIECIDSFLHSGCNIYVLNNGSEKRSVAKMTERYKDNQYVNIINESENLGPSRGRNRLIELSKEKWLFFIDNDISISPATEWTEILKKFISENPFAEIICPALFNVHENAFASHPEFILRGNEVHIEYSGKSTNNYFPSGASLVKRSIFERYGLFDENLFAFEDYEYAIRMLCHPGASLIVFNIPGITLRHDHKFQQSKEDKHAAMERYNFERLEASFARIQEKHQVMFEHDWKWWSNRQLKNMIGARILERISNKIASIFK